MKKAVRMLTLACLCMMVLLCLTGCECSHKYDQWQVDSMTHWHTCSKCGEDIHKDAHDLEMGNQCKVCEYYIYPDESDSLLMESYVEMGAKSKVII